MSFIKKMIGYGIITKNVICRPLIVKSLPRHVQIEITTFCNMNCLSCGRRYIIDKPKHMSYETFKKVYDEIRPRNINLSGLGEPTMNPEVFKMITYARKNGSIVNFPTNLTLPKSVMDKLVKSQIDQIKVSIDAASKEGYKKVRKYDKFDNVVENIKYINEAKKKRGFDKPEIRFNFCLQKYNLKELPALVELANKLGVKTIYVQDLNYYSVEKEKKELCGIPIEELKKTLQETDKLSKKHGIHTNISNWKSNMKAFYNKMLPKKQYVPNKTRCNFPWVSSFIDVHGNVKLCPVFVWQKDAKALGNIHEKSFKEIWNSKEYQQLRKEFRKNTRSNPICKRCVPPNILDMKLILEKMLLRR
jgi:radical SAM protein with 4Fe4S-binding SPASM domain